MAKSNETGHVKNVANFKTLVNYIESLGATYQPTKVTEQLPALKQLLAEAEANSTELTAIKPVYSKAVDDQITAFAPISKLSTRIGNAYAYVAESEEHTQTVKSLLSAIRGGGGKTATGEKAADAVADGAEPETRSTSQLSYDNRQQNFEELVQTIIANTNYNPAEEELKTAYLKTVSADLKSKTEAVDKAYTPILKARSKRDKTLYNKPNNLYDTVEAIKKYLKSVYGTSSAELKFVNGLTFRKPTK